MLLNESVVESNEKMQAVLERRPPGDVSSFVPPAPRSRQFDQALVAVVRAMPVAELEALLPDYVRLSALLVLQKELLREWNQAVFTMLLQDQREVKVSLDDGGGSVSVRRNPAMKLRRRVRTKGQRGTEIEFANSGTKAP